MPKPKKAKEPDPNKLIRESAGRYRSEDGRFTVESEGTGAWYLADAEQANELGMPVLRGPFATLSAVREALAAARDAPPPKPPEVRPRRDADRPPAEESGAPARPSRRSRPARLAPERGTPSQPPRPRSWLDELDPARRREAETLIATLEALGVDDAPALVRRDVERDEPVVAARLLRRQVETNAVDPWAASAGWVTAALAGRGPLRDQGDLVRRALDTGLDRDGLRELARAIAERVAELTLGVVQSGGFEAGAGRPPRGWRLVETDSTGEPTGRDLPDG